MASWKGETKDNAKGRGACWDRVKVIGRSFDELIPRYVFER